MKARYVLIALLAILALTLGACAPAPAPAPQVVEKVVEKIVTQEVKVVETQVVEVEKVQTQVVEKIVEATPSPEAMPVVTWFQYDQGNVDPQSDERVGNEYLRNAIPEFNKDFEGKYYWDNQFTPWDRLEAKVVAAAQAGAELPDIVEAGAASVNRFYTNAAVQDLTEWAKAQPWYSEMDESAINLCTGPDGKLYCIPMALRPSTVFVWKDRYPNGFPKTTEEWLKEGERLKEEGKYALTFFGSTDFNGNGAARAVFMNFISHGGGYDDGSGKIKLNTPENIAAVEFLREMVQKGYVPEIAFAGGFQEEQAFMDSSAGAIPTGLFGYRYMNPLTAPNGTKYDTKTEKDMLNAIDAGDAFLAPMPAPEGNKPGCGGNVTSLFIPVGAPNPDGAKEMINWLLSPDHNPIYVLGPGAGIPVLKSVAATEQFQSTFYKQAEEVVAASNCEFIWPTVTKGQDAEKAIMNAVYKLIKTDPTADIATELQKAEDEFNNAQ